jgi:hypothetical protein
MNVEGIEIDKKNATILDNKMSEKYGYEKWSAMKESVREFRESVKGLTLKDQGKELKIFKKEFAAEFDVGRLAVGIIVAVVVIVIAVSLIPTIMSSTAAVSTNTTYKKDFPSAMSLLILIPLIFVAGILVIILYMLFTKE